MVTAAEYSALSAATYAIPTPNSLDATTFGWSGTVSEDESALGLGFKSTVYTRGIGPSREIVIAYGGTDGLLNIDWATNIAAGLACTMREGRDVGAHGVESCGVDA